MAEEHQRLDFVLEPDEKIEGIFRAHPLSQLRSYAIGGVLVLLGAIVAKAAFSYPSFADALFLFFSLGALIVLLAIRPGGGSVTMLSSLILWALLIYLAYAFIPLLPDIMKALMVNPSEMGSLTPQILERLQPTSIIFGLLDLTMQFLVATYEETVTFLPIIGPLIVAIGLLTIIFSYFYTRGNNYYVTDRRIVVSKRFGGKSVHEVTYDWISDVSMVQGPFARAFNYGDVVFSSGGRDMSERPTMPKPKPLSAVSGVETRLKGVKSPRRVKDLISAIKQKFIEASYLKRIEEEAKRMASAMEELTKRVKKRKKQPVEQVVEESSREAPTA